MKKSRVIANYGIERNKKPLANIIYTIEVVSPTQLKPSTDLSKLEEFKFKDLGYITITSEYEGKEESRAWNGFRTPKYIQTLLGEKQWSKFCQGKRKFVIQRRYDGKNIKLVKQQIFNQILNDNL